MFTPYYFKKKNKYIVCISPDSKITTTNEHLAEAIVNDQPLAQSIFFDERDKPKNVALKIK